MTTHNRILAAGLFAMLSFTAPNANAMLPACQSTSSDPDGDGYGWENNTSCVVTTAASTNEGELPGCLSASSDPDGDGYGWENGASCIVGGGTSNGNGTVSNSSGTPNCASADSDSDGDGYGWENGASCLVIGGASTDTGSTGTGTTDDRPSCVSAESDPNGDGYGWENGATCLVTESTDSGGTDDGLVSNDDSSGDSGSGSNEESADTDTGNSGAVIRTTTLPAVGTNTVSVNASGGDLFATEKVGDFLLMQNAWRAWRAAAGYDWNQSIYTNTNGALVGWNYDWGPGVPGASGRASDDYYVRSYPELIFGVKDEYRTSAPKSSIGFPVRVDAMADVSIDYSYTAPEYGNARVVDASVNSNYPNGSTIAGERNIAIESFLYESVNGVCDDSLPVTRTGGSNHVYEVMVWLDAGAERLPAGPSDYVTTINLRDADYKVYTKNNDNRYIAFVAQNPQTSGTVHWNDFVDWARLNAHRVEEVYGANSNSLQIQDSWCVANIIIGTEIFWGAGNFDLYDWTITQRQP